MRAAGQGAWVHNLYNNYIYFWRWATWRATQELGSGPGIVAFITPSSYIDGSSAGGLRSHFRDVFDDFYIIDLGGDARGAVVDGNVFDIQTPVAIGIGVRRRGTADGCNVWHAQPTGTREDKFDWLDQSFESITFTDIAGSGFSRFTSSASGPYADWPVLEDLLSSAFTGPQFYRTWPIAVDESILERRWTRLLESRDRGEALKVSRDRTLDSTPPPLQSEQGRLPALRVIPDDASHEPIRRYGFRSFDRQYALADARVADYGRPDLWKLAGPRQVFFTTLTTDRVTQGPVVTATPYVPDCHHFRGRGSRDIYPMWLDRDGEMSNVSASALQAIAETYGSPRSGERVAQYIYGLGGTGAFATKFRQELQSAGPFHLPITKDPALFDEVAALGEELLVWHTWGERYGEIPILSGQAVEVEKITGKPETVKYDAHTQTLFVGNGRVSPVSAEVWNFEVSGFKPLQKWLGYRKAQRAGRSSSPLDALTYDQWSFTDELLLVINILQHTVDLTQRASELLERVVTGKNFSSKELS